MSTQRTVNDEDPAVKNMLNRCERMVNGVCFEIIVHTLKGEEKERYLLDVDPENEKFMGEVDEKDETLDQRLARIAHLQEIHKELWERTDEKLEECKKKYQNTDCKIVLLKRKSDKNQDHVKFIVRRHDESDKLSRDRDRYSTASTAVISDSEESSDYSSESDDDESSYQDQLKRKAEYPKLSCCTKFVIIGPNRTQIKRSDYELMNWASAPSSTRKLLVSVFGEQVLATHSITGYSGREGALKGILDPHKVNDIVYIVTLKLKVNPQIVRTTISMKCSDSARKLRLLAMKA